MAEGGNGLGFHGGGGGLEDRPKVSAGRGAGMRSDAVCVRVLEVFRAICSIWVSGVLRALLAIFGVDRVLRGSSR